MFKKLKNIYYCYKLGKYLQSNLGKIEDFTIRYKDKDEDCLKKYSNYLEEYNWTIHNMHYIDDDDKLYEVTCINK